MLNTHKSEAAQQKTQHHGNTVLVRSMPKQSLPQPHRSFLLRCWQVQAHETTDNLRWRFSLREVAENPEEYGFANVEQLIDFLLNRLNEEQESGRS